MKTILVNNRLTIEERETVLVYSSVDKTWHMDTTVPKHANKAKKQGWKQTVEYVYDDGSLCGGAFEAPARAITIRNAEKKQMSEKQLGNLRDNEDEDDED
jgi:hypothetical protein